jgi:hypothetical protein
LHPPVAYARIDADRRNNRRGKSAPSTAGSAYFRSIFSASLSFGSPAPPRYLMHGEATDQRDPLRVAGLAGPQDREGS